MELYSKLTSSWAMMLRAASQLPDEGFIKSLPNVRMFLQSTMMKRNHRSSLYFKKKREILEMFNLSWSCVGITKSCSFNLREAHYRLQKMAGVSDNTYLLGVAYFAQARAEIDSCRFTILRSFADPFKINPKAATELKHLPKFLSEVYMSASFRLIASTFPSEYRSLDAFREQYWAPILNKVV